MSARERRVTINYKDQRLYAYPSPLYAKLIKAYADINEISDSEAGQMAIKTFIDNLPPDQKSKIGMSIQPQQSKNTY